jgi:hypothetical protein
MRVAVEAGKVAMASTIPEGEPYYLASELQSFPYVTF